MAPGAAVPPLAPKQVKVKKARKHDTDRLLYVPSTHNHVVVQAKSATGKNPFYRHGKWEDFDGYVNNERRQIAVFPIWKPGDEWEVMWDGGDPDKAQYFRKYKLSDSEMVDETKPPFGPGVERPHTGPEGGAFPSFDLQA